MSLETKIFEFDRFVLDIPDRTLYFDGKIVNISIKAFDVLRVLFENRPHVVEKKALMAAVWPDSFVEEGNLTFTISQLRKALDDSKKDPRIIETVHRRGYRFIATVRENSNEDSFKEGVSRSETRYRWIRWSALTVAILVILGVAGFMIVGRSSYVPPILKGPLSIEKLSTSGTVVHAVIAPDGKYVIYTNGTGRDQQSIWLRQLDSGSTIEIVKPSDSRYRGLAISPDSNFLYFARTTSTTELSIFRLSVFGGIPQRIAEGTQGWIGLSPDGQLISYVKCRNDADEKCSLYVANFNGRNQWTEARDA